MDAFACRCGSRRGSTPGTRTARPSTSIRSPRTLKPVLLGLALLLAAGWLAFDRLYARAGDEPVRWTDVTPAGRLHFARPVERVFQTRAELREVFPQPPAIDFRRRRAVLVATGPRSSSGYDVEVTAVRAERRRVVVTVRGVGPTLGQPVRPRVTFPFRLITLPRDDRPVEVER